MSVLTSLEAKEVPLACTVYNRLEDLRSYLKSGLSKSSFGVQTDCLPSIQLSKRENTSNHFRTFLSCPFRNWRSTGMRIQLVCTTKLCEYLTLVSYLLLEKILETMGLWKHFNIHLLNCLRNGSSLLIATS